MAFPVIIIDSQTGSDSQASGAGPGDGTTSGSPLFGTAAQTSDGLTVTLDGSPDLTNVLTDGSHVLFLLDTVSAARNFGPIMGKANSGSPTAQVTVQTGFAFGFPLSGKTWAIGGKRVSFGSTTSKKLVDNVSNGDMLPGWTARFKSGHSEAYNASITFRRAGASTGRITIEGESGYSVMPLLTQQGNFPNLTLNALTYITIQNLKFANSGVASKTSSIAVNTPGSGCVVRNCRADDAANAVLSLVNSGAAGVLISDSYALSTVGNSFVFMGAIVRNNYAKNATLSGFVDNSVARNKSTIQGNVAAGCTVAGLSIAGAAAGQEDASLISGNVFHGNANAITIAATSTNFVTLVNLVIENNVLTASSGAAISLAGAGVDDALLAACGTIIRYNNFGTGATANGSDITAACAATPTNSLHVDPGYADTANDNYSVGVNLKAQGWPPINVGGLTTGTRSYVDIGPQRQEPPPGGLVIQRRMLKSAGYPAPATVW